MTPGRASWMYVMVPVRAAKALGIDVTPHLAACGLELDVADPKATWYPYDAAQALWERLAAAAKDEAFGLTVAGAQNDDPASWGVLEYVARNSRDFGDALGRIARYGQLMHDHATVELRDDPAGGFFTYRIPEASSGPNRFAAQWAAAAWVLRGRKFVGADFNPLEVTFRHATPADLSTYQQVFRCPVRFGCPETGVLVSHADLARPMIGADVALLAVVDGHAKELVDRLPQKTLESQVRTYLTRALSTGGDSSLTAIASAIAMSTRTLQRRLGDEGLSHRDMVDEIRCELARRMVTHTQLSNNEMTFLLGFAEAPAFLRAFKRWVGQSPGEVRGKKGTE
ncbi:MAG: AraC family transcriptional regulator [Myxococcales bacterium]|nr:AraC family transcriptional regulator [Myxococcales bacterium]